MFIKMALKFLIGSKKFSDSNFEKLILYLNRISGFEIGRFDKDIDSAITWELLTFEKLPPDTPARSAEKLVWLIRYQAFFYAIAWYENVM